jgi:hypothetical protein
MLVGSGGDFELSFSVRTSRGRLYMDYIRGRLHYFVAKRLGGSWGEDLHVVPQHLLGLAQDDEDDGSGVVLNPAPARQDCHGSEIRGLRSLPLQYGQNAAGGAKEKVARMLCKKTNTSIEITEDHHLLTVWTVWIHPRFYSRIVPRIVLPIIPPGFYSRLWAPDCTPD